MVIVQYMKRNVRKERLREWALRDYSEQIEGTQ